MKKLLLLAVLGLTAVTAMAQGRISFRNTTSTQFNVFTNNALGNALGLMQTQAVAQYRFGLYASPTTGAAEGSLVLIGLATNAVSPNFLGKIFGADPFPITAAGYSAGSPITFQIRGWSIAGGLSYEEALLASAATPLDIALGKSGIGTTTPTASPGTPGALFGTNPGLLSTGFTLVPTPEPSSIALGLLGLGAIAMFRRKK